MAKRSRLARAFTKYVDCSRVRRDPSAIAQTSGLAASQVSSPFSGVHGGILSRWGIDGRAAKFFPYLSIASASGVGDDCFHGIAEPIDLRR